jgi:hypothetical protein
MTEEQRKLLYNQMAQIFDNDIAPYVDLKCFGENIPCSTKKFRDQPFH